MNPIFITLSKYFWAIALLISIPNTLLIKRRFQPHIEADPSLKEGYSKMLKHFVFWMNLPWLFMGVCMFLGDIPHIWSFFRPQDGDPYVLAWHFSVYGLWALSAYWIYLNGGAKRLIKYPGFFNTAFKSELAVKGFCALMLLGGIAAVTMMHMMDVPIDDFPILNESK